MVFDLVQHGSRTTEASRLETFDSESCTAAVAQVKAKYPDRTDISLYALPGRHGVPMDNPEMNVVWMQIARIHKMLKHWN